MPPTAVEPASSTSSTVVAAKQITKETVRSKNRKTVHATVVPDYDMGRDKVALTEDLVTDIFGSDTRLGRSHRYVAMRSATGSLPQFAWNLYEAIPSAGTNRGVCSVSAAHHTSSSQQEVLLAAVEPVALEHVILTLPSTMYSQIDTIQSDSKAILEKLGLHENRILRQGEHLLDLGCRVQLCEPVDQGIVVNGKIKITIVCEDNNDYEANKSPQVNGHIDESELAGVDFEFEISKFLEGNSRSPASGSVSLDVWVLDSPLSRDSLVPQPGALDDLETTVFVRTEQLVRVGVFSGDLVQITSDKASRVARVFSYPEPNTLPVKAVFMSPFLAFNLGNVDSITLNKLEKQVPPMVAKEVTISRVASPVTTDRVYQQAFLSSLRSYFESSYRIVKLGDVIAVPIDTILAQTLHVAGANASNNGVMPAGKPNEVAWFKITSLDNGSPDNGESANTDVECVIDPSGTRMVQSGIIKQECVPSGLRWRSYLGLEEYPDYNAAKPGGNAEDFAYARKLRQIVKTAISPLAREAHLQSSVLIHSSKRGTGKATLVYSIAAELGVHVFEIDCYSIIADTDVKTIGALKARIERAAGISPCIVLIKHLDNLAKKSEQDGTDGNGVVSSISDVLQEYMISSDLVFVATAADVDKLSEAVRSKFKFEISVGVPSESERRKIFELLTVSRPLVSKSLTGFQVKNIHLGFELAGDVAVTTLAQQSAGLTPPDLVSIIEAAKIKAIERLQAFEDANAIDLILCSRGLVKISSEDVEGAIGLARSKYSDSIGAPKIPNVQWKDVGGLEGVKKEILDTIEMPLKYPQLFSSGVKKRSGILFYGPPGTGKTLLAKAIATTFSLNFFSVKGPELLNMYIGESEANVRRVFQKARDARPCVVFFDELDSVAPKRGNQGDSGGVMDRIVSQLLAELDGMSGRGGEGVFVVGATNRPDLLDEALLRPGRFDKMLYLGISDTHDKQKNILQALTRKFELADNVSLERIASKCPFTYTGADFYAMSSDAMLNAMTRTAGVVDEKLKAYNETIRKPQGLKDVSTRWWFQNVATKEDIAVQVTEADFDKALRELIPSVSAEELQHYLRVRANFEGGKKQAPPSQSEAQLPQVNGLSIANGPSPTPVANGEKTLQATEKKKNKGKGPMPEY